jgi:hypothetical protein
MVTKSYGQSLRDGVSVMYNRGTSKQMQYRDINLLYPSQGPLGADAAGYSREIHAPAIRPRHYRQIVVRGIDDVFAIDLAVMHGWRDEWYGKLSENDGMKYMLLVVDVFSKYLSTYGMIKKLIKKLTHTIDIACIRKLMIFKI